MEKSVIATNIDGFLLEHEVFTEPHKYWFERAIAKTGDESLKKWVNQNPYFPGVIIAMKQIMPNATEEQRTTQARKWYQEDVIRYIKENPKSVKRKNARLLRLLTMKFKLILITTNTKDYINKILEVSNLKGIYEDIIASKTEKEPNKEELIDEFLKKYQKPKYYITGKSEDEITKKFKELNVKIVEEKNFEKFSF